MDTSPTIFLYRVVLATGGASGDQAEAGMFRCLGTDMAGVLEQLNARFPEASRIEVRKISPAKLFA